MLLAVTSLAAGMKLTITSNEARIAFGPALLLAGGVALYLVGDPLLWWAMPLPHSTCRIGAAAVSIVTIALGTFVVGWHQLFGTLRVMLLLEARHL
jgi:disulfide bond formation protein DsbB